MKLISVTIVAFATTVGVARAETTLCTNIASLPATITTAGAYCLKQDLSTTMTSGFAISIEANSVVLDLNGFRLGGAGAGTSTMAVGIATFKDNVTIRNGSVRGFGTNLQVSGTNNVVEGMKIDSARQTGIKILGIGHIVRNNDVTRTTGTAIEAGLGPILIDSNTVSIVSGTVVTGILLSSAHSSVVQNNTIMQLNGSTSARGIRSFLTDNVVVRNNVIQNFTAATTGIDLSGGAADGCFDNIISGSFATILVGCEIDDNNRKF